MILIFIICIYNEADADDVIFKCYLLFGKENSSTDRLVSLMLCLLFFYLMREKLAWIFIDATKNVCNVYFDMTYNVMGFFLNRNHSNTKNHRNVKW